MLRSSLSRGLIAGLGLSLGIGAAGGCLFHFLGLPLAWMSGPMMANIGASLARLPVKVPMHLRSSMLAIIGIYLGSSFSPELSERIGEWPWSLSAVIIMTLLTTATVAIYYRKIAGFDPITALFSATPGALGAMIVIGGAAGGREQYIAITQSLRIVVVVLLIPMIVMTLAPSPAILQPPSPSTPAPVDEIVMLATGGAFGVGIARLLRFPAYQLTGAMLASALLYMQGWVSLTLPDELLAITLWILGSALGARFASVSPRQLLAVSHYAVGAVLITLLLAATSAALLNALLGVDFLPAMLALTPGGVAEMCLIAVAFDIDPGFVAFHHLVRLFAIITLAPIASRWISRNGD